MDPGYNSSRDSLQLPQDEKISVKWIENQPAHLHAQFIQESFRHLLNKLCQPGFALSNNCSGLCHFIEQCRKSNCATVRCSAYSQNICSELFIYYLEWSEKDQNRSMRRVLELVSTLIATNTDAQAAKTIKLFTLRKCFSSIGNELSKPLVKSAFKSLEYFMRKGIISAPELIAAFEEYFQNSSKLLIFTREKQDSLWNVFVARVFDWMSVPNISPIAGKFLVTIFRQIRTFVSSMTDTGDKITTWQVWIKRALTKEPDLLENIKNHLLSPLFNLDRSASFEFLENLNSQIDISKIFHEAVDPQALLRLAALEVGKKVGLVEDSAILSSDKLPKNHSKTISLNENVFESLLMHKSDLVRSLSFSVLVSSSSPLRPLSPTTLRIIKLKLHIMYSNTDVKFRIETLTTIKKLIERLRGSTSFLVREICVRKQQIKNGHNLTETENSQVNNILRQTEDLLQDQILFIEWWFEFLQEELIPTASYQRHITSLKTIYLWLGSGILNNQRQVIQVKVIKLENKIAWPFTINLFTQRFIRVLMDLLVDPFEDVRNFAQIILKASSPSHYMEQNCFSLAGNEGKVDYPSKKPCNSSVKQHQVSGKDIDVLFVTIDAPLNFLTDFIRLIEEVSDKSGRANYADGFARSNQILYHLQASEQDRTRFLIELVNVLEKKVAIAERNLTQAIQDTPLHGSFATLNLIWETLDLEQVSKNICIDDINWMQNLQNKILDICTRVWIAVKPVLCNDSPQGHLPMEFEELETIDTKDVLSYSFRAIHESSNLLRTIVNKHNHQHGGPTSLAKNTFARISNLSFEKLSTLRHRGAFSTVSLTFSTCCKLAPRYYQHKFSGDESILSSWLKDAFVCLETQVSTTRRSAGIPSIITAIMSAVSAEDFEKNIRKLLTIASRESKNVDLNQEQLPQVHALNCLKDILKSVTTSARVDPYISECFEVVGQSLSSPVWAIRNSSLILLRSLIDNLIGTSDSKLTSETGWDGKSIVIRYEKYPALPRILMQLLQHEHKDSEHGDNENHVVLPALGIIRRAGPPLELRDELNRILPKLLSSKTWHLREQAAKTISILQPRGDELCAISNLLDYTGGSINYQHGSALAAKLILLERGKEFSYCLNQLCSIYQQVLNTVYQTQNPFILIEYVEMANLVLEIIMNHPDLRETGKRYNYILQISENYWGIDSSENFVQHLAKVASYSNLIVPLFIQGYLRQKITISILLNNGSIATKIIEEVMNFGLDLLVATLEKIVTAWKLPMSEEACCDVLSTLIRVLENTKDTETLRSIMQITSQILKTSKTIVKTQSKLVQHLLEILGDYLILKGQGSPILLSMYYALSGYTTLFRLNSSLSDEEKVNLICCWIQGLERSSMASQDFNLRYSAVTAIKEFYLHAPPDQPLEIESQCLKLNYVLMTLLVDDEEDIRDLAASIVSDILGSSMAPVAARDALLKYQARKAKKYNHFAWYCIHNLLPFDFLISKLNPIAPDLMLQAACTVDYSLFAIEEHNFFSDPCTMLDLSSKAFLEYPFAINLQNYDPKSNLNSELHTLLEWTAAGIISLQRRYPIKENPKFRINNQSFNTSLTPVFLSIRRIIVCGKTAVAYWKKNSESIVKFKNGSAEGNALVETWERNLLAINEGLAAISFQSDIHDSLRSFAAKPLDL